MSPRQAPARARRAAAIEPLVEDMKRAIVALDRGALTPGTALVWCAALSWRARLTGQQLAAQASAVEVKRAARWWRRELAELLKSNPAAPKANQ